MAFPEAFYQYLKEHTLVEIKGGRHRETFLEIWMVNVGERVFARSWSKSNKSWLTAFIEEGVGLIKFGDKLVSVYGKKLEKNPELTSLINKEYLAKYNQEANISYAQGITQAAYEDFTMEFFFDSIV